MATIHYTDGRRFTGLTLEEAIEHLEKECEVVEECGDRYLAWATQEDADGPHNDGDDGSRAVAEIIGYKDMDEE